MKRRSLLYTRVPVASETPGFPFAGTDETVSLYARAIAQPSKAENLWQRRPGAYETRPGTTLVGSAVGATRVLGLVTFEKINADGSIVRKLVSGSGSEWKAYTEAAGWVTIASGLASGAPFSGAMWQNTFLVLTNGLDNVKKYDGTAVADLGGTPPKARFVFTAYKRVFLLGSVTTPTVLYVSDVNDAEAWATGDAGQLNIGGNDPLVAGVAVGGRIIIWTKAKCFELRGPEAGYTLASGRWTFVEIAPFGLASQNAFAVVRDTVFWLTNGGIAAWSGGKAEIVSEPLHDTFSQINPGAVDFAAMGVFDEGKVLLVSLPLGTNAYPNVVASLDVTTGTWVNRFSTAWTAVCFSAFMLAAKNFTVFGDAAGRVWRIDY